VPLVDLLVSPAAIPTPAASAEEAVRAPRRRRRLRAAGHHDVLRVERHGCWSWRRCDCVARDPVAKRPASARGRLGNNLGARAAASPDR
jgi:hypothetical protein